MGNISTYYLTSSEVASQPSERKISNQPFTRDWLIADHFTITTTLTRAAPPIILTKTPV